MSGYGLQGPSRSGWRDPRDTAYPDTGRNIESSRREGYYGGGYYQNGDGSGTGALEAPFSQQQGWGSKDAGPSVTRDESRPMEGYGSSMSNIQRRPSAGSQMQSSHASFRQPNSPSYYTSPMPPTTPNWNQYGDRTELDHRTPQASSPTLPALTTTSASNGAFGDLFSQLEAQMDEIQSRHNSPMSSPITPTTNTLGGTGSLRHPDSSALHPSIQDSRRGSGSGSGTYSQTHTPRGSDFSAQDSIISMYGRTTPSPRIGYQPEIRPPHPAWGVTEYSGNPKPVGQIAPNEQVSFPMSASTASTSPYLAHSRTERMDHQANGASAQSHQAQAQSQSFSSLQNSTATRQPSKYVPRPRTTSANTVHTVNNLSQNSHKHNEDSLYSSTVGASTPVRPLPMSPPTSTHTSSGSRSSQNTFSSPSSSARPSQEGYGYFGSSSSIADRSIASSSSSISSVSIPRSLSGKGREVRPLPVPSEDSAPYQSASAPKDNTRQPARSATVSGANGMSQSRDRKQSDFAKEFYSAGGVVPDTIRPKPSIARPTPSGSAHSDGRVTASQSERIRKKSSQSSLGVSAGVGDAMSLSQSMPSSLYPSSIQRQTSSATIANGARTVSAGQYAQATPSSSSLSNRAAPPMIHAHSDPSTSPSSSTTAGYRRSPFSTPGSINEQRQSPASAHRQASEHHTRSSGSGGRGHDSGRTASSSVRRNVSLPNRQQAQPSMTSSPPPVPASPAISISPSFGANIDTPSSYSGSSYFTGPPTTTLSHNNTIRSQTSLSPSGRAPSLNGSFAASTAGSSYFSLLTPNAQPKRADSTAHRKRMKELGLQHVNPALLSHLSTALKERVSKGQNVKGSVRYERSFTGQEIVSTLAEILPHPYTDNRNIALMIGRTLYRNMFFHEVEWEDPALRDSMEDVFTFDRGDLDEDGVGSEASSIDLQPPKIHDENSFDPQLYSTGSYSFAAGPSYGMQPTVAGTRSSRSAINHAISETVPLPSGVITRFTKCYSPFCGMPGTSNAGACYSLYCPNGDHPLGLQRKASHASLTPVTEEVPPADDWASTVTKELIESLDKKEIARQNIIYELVKGEHAQKKDLDMLETAYYEALREADPPIVHPMRLIEFCNGVFANLEELRMYSSRLINAFQTRQREQSPLVQSIGDIMLDAALEWKNAYLEYAETQVWGKHLVQEEMAANPAFVQFLASRREAFSLRQDFAHFHSRPTFRLPRIPMILERYLEATPADHTDRENTLAAIRIVKDICTAMDEVIHNAELNLAKLKYDKLIEKDGNYSNLDLRDPSRRLYHHGKMYAKPEGASLSEWTELQVMLFDHCLVIAKPRRTAEGYRLIRKPIRLEMLSVSGFDDQPQMRSSGFHLRDVMRTSDRREERTAVTESRAWPIVFRIGGRLGGTLTLWVENSKMDKVSPEDKARKEWREQLENAIAVRVSALESNKVFDIRLLVDPEKRKSPADGKLTSLGRILSSCPFTGPSGQRLVAVGTTSGFYIAVQYDPSSLRQILPFSTLQCAVLQDFGMILLQREGRLLAYLLEELVQVGPSDYKGQQGPQQISGQKDITFFKIGKVGSEANSRTLVVYVKKVGVNSTALKALEPVSSIERNRVQQSRFLGMGGKKTDWFRLYKDGGVPTEVYNLSFTRKKLALVCAPGFEILDFETLHTGSFPDWAALRADTARYDARLVQLQRRCSEARALALFRISDKEFLFCYDTFAFYADRLGDPLPERYGDIIEWEGRPDSVVFYQPYVLAFDSEFVEIRDALQRGKLCQIIRGHNMRCSYDGQGIPTSEIEIGRRGEGSRKEGVEKRPHLVMRENGVDKMYELSLRRSS